MVKKVYARQVPPEYQESPMSVFGDDEFFEGVCVCGNRDYRERTTELFDEIKSVLMSGEMADYLENLDEYSDVYKDEAEVIADYITKGKGEYTPEQIDELKELAIRFNSCPRSQEDEIICKVLSIADGREWDVRTISGCCQGDWNYMYYPVDDWSREALKRFETEYFNTGTEWCVDEGDFDPENDNPSDIEGAYYYATSWNEDGIKKEIADAEGCAPEDVVLYEFSGWIKTAKYKEA